MPEVALEGPLGQFDELSGHLHTGRSGSDDDEGHQAWDLGVTAFGGGHLGELERSVDPATQLERIVDALHPRRVDRELVPTEPRLRSTRSDDEVVVMMDMLGPQGPSGHRAGSEVDVGHLAEEHVGVALARQHLAGGRGDLAGAEDPGRHLIEQRLEQVVARLGEDRHVDIGPLEGSGGEQAPEPGADDDDARAGTGAGGRWVCSHVRGNVGQAPRMPSAHRGAHHTWSRFGDVT